MGKNTGLTSQFMKLEKPTKEEILYFHPDNRPLSYQQLETFLLQPGINIAGICSEAGITQQYLNRCRKAGELPGSKVMAKLLPVMVKYGFKN